MPKNRPSEVEIYGATAELSADIRALIGFYKNNERSFSAGIRACIEKLQTAVAYKGVLDRPDVSKPGEIQHILQETLDEIDVASLGYTSYRSWNEKSYPKLAKKITEINAMISPPEDKAATIPGDSSVTPETLPIEESDDDETPSSASEKTQKQKELEKKAGDLLNFYGRHLPSSRKLSAELSPLIKELPGLSAAVADDNSPGTIAFKKALGRINRICLSERFTNPLHQQFIKKVAEINDAINPRLAAAGAQQKDSSKPKTSLPETGDTIASIGETGAGTLSIEDLQEVLQPQYIATPTTSGILKKKVIEISIASPAGTQQKIATISQKDNSYHTSFPKDAGESHKRAVFASMAQLFVNKEIREVTIQGGTAKERKLFADECLKRGIDVKLKEGILHAQHGTFHHAAIDEKLGKKEKGIYKPADEHKTWRQDWEKQNEKLTALQTEQIALANLDHEKKNPALQALDKEIETLKAAIRRGDPADQLMKTVSDAIGALINPSQSTTTRLPDGANEILTRMNDTINPAAAAPQQQPQQTAVPAAPVQQTADTAERGQGGKPSECPHQAEHAKPTFPPRPAAKTKDPLTALDEKMMKIYSHNTDQTEHELINTLGAVHRTIRDDSKDYSNISQKINDALLVVNGLAEKDHRSGPLCQQYREVLTDMRKIVEPMAIEQQKRELTKQSFPPVMRAGRKATDEISDSGDAREPVSPGPGGGRQ